MNVKTTAVKRTACDPSQHAHTLFVCMTYEYGLCDEGVFEIFLVRFFFFEEALESSASFLVLALRGFNNGWVIWYEVGLTQT